MMSFISKMFNETDGENTNSNISNPSPVDETERHTHTAPQHLEDVATSIEDKDIAQVKAEKKQTEKSEKLKFAFMLAGGCAGCEMALIDISEKLVDTLDHLEIVFWAPTAADVKYKDLEAYPDNFIDLAFVDGMVRNTENEHMVTVLRQKSKVLVAFGACATVGGVAAMGDLHTKDELFDYAYKQSWSTDNPDGVLPTSEYILDGKYNLTIPAFTDRCMTIAELVDVDFFIGGCPPHHDFIAATVNLVLSGEMPAKGTWLTSGKAVCDVCTRNPAITGEMRRPVGQVFRTVEGQPDPVKCLLQQGYICFGPMTQGDCGAACLKANMPCRGCGGPIPGIKDFGARCLTTIGSTLKDERTCDQLMEKYPQLAKFVYRYSYTSGMIDKRKSAESVPSRRNLP